MNLSAGANASFQREVARKQILLFYLLRTSGWPSISVGSVGDGTDAVV
jgi:hypothetical protein